MKLFPFLIVVLIICLTGCTANKPKDLKVSKVAKIGRNDLEQLVRGSIGKSWVEGEFLVVRLSTELDLVKYAKQKGYVLSSTGRFCDDLDSPVMTFGLYSEIESIKAPLISLQGSKLAHLLQSKDKGSLNYYILTPVSFLQDVEIFGRPERKDAIFYKKYNLAENPKDLCFSVRGSSYGFGFKSNMAILKKEKINKMVNE